MATYMETDLFTPVKTLFESMGYKVNAEVKGCDVTAYKDGEIAIIEMKNSFNLRLLYQGLDRQRITTKVYLAVPRPRGFNSSDSVNMRRIVRRLELGLIYVALGGAIEAAEIIFEPGGQGLKGVRKDTRKKAAVMSEIENRKMDTNKGGSSGVKLNTAYRERCIKIACIIEQRGTQSAKALIRDYGCERDAGAILSRCPYNWFTRTSRGIYDLSPTGHEFLNGMEFRTQIDYYRGLYGH